MRIQQIAVSLCAVYLLSACATATRGSKTLLIVNTTPTGADVTTNVETKNSKKTISKQNRKDAISAQTTEDLEFTYKGCSPTPCGIEVSRRSTFIILVSKEGYAAQIINIDHIHRKDVTLKNAKKVAVGTGTAAGAGAAAAVVAGLEVLGGSIAAPLALAAALPILTVGGTSLVVDAASGANYDLTPNPVDVLLELTEETAPNIPNEISSKFILRRQQLSAGTIEATTCSVKAPNEIPCKSDDGAAKTCNVTIMKEHPCFKTNEGDIVD